MSVRDYYNTVRKERPDKSKPKTIVVLLRMLEDNEFVYRTRVSVDESEAGITRKLIQLFWAHRKQLDAAPPRAIGASQGGTSITLAIRSPEAPQRCPSTFRLFPEEPSAPPASTAPPRLATEEGRGKRKRTHTNTYKQSVEDGELDESQHGKAARP